jgi:lipid A 3-O-deacylase
VQRTDTPDAVAACGRGNCGSNAAATKTLSRTPARSIAAAGLLLVAFFWPFCAPAPAAAAPVIVATPSAPADAQRDAGKEKTEGVASETLPDQYGVSAEYGYAYDPHRNIDFLLARVFAIYDYGTIWHMNRPKALRFKVEGAVGSTLNPSNDLMASANMLALYYPGSLSGRTWRPYLEAGIGVIYTEFRVPGQGLHFNFNPLLGVGCELPQQNGKNPFAAIRLHHLSNAGIDHDNRGVNSVELQIGRYF